MSNKKCSHCGLVNFADAEACKRCKASLQIKPVAEPPPVAPPVADFHQPPAPIVVNDNSNLFPCPDCGQMVSYMASFCPRCGRAFRAWSPAPVSQPQIMYQTPPKQKSALDQIAIIVIAIIAAVIIIILC